MSTQDHLTYKVPEGKHGSLYYFMGEAQKLSQKHDGRPVQFEFNRALLTVTPETTQAEIKQMFDDVSEAYRKAYRASPEGIAKKAEWDAKQQQIQELFNTVSKKIENVELNLIDLDKWSHLKESNPYVTNKEHNDTAFRFAERWGKLMQVELEAAKKGKNPTAKEFKKVADQTTWDADAKFGVSFEWFASVRILADTWEHGDKLKKWYDKRHPNYNLYYDIK